MNRIVKQLHKSFGLMKKRNWDKIYVAIDVHETISKPTWDETLALDFYENSIDTLKLLSDRKDICLILWTSSKEENKIGYFNILKENNIHFNYINSNPEVAERSYADYESKFYINLILDDKAGWLPEDWLPLKEYLLVKKLSETKEENTIEELIHTYFQKFN